MGERVLWSSKQWRVVEHALETGRFLVTQMFADGKWRERVSWSTDGIEAIRTALLKLVDERDAAITRNAELEANDRTREKELVELRAELAALKASPASVPDAVSTEVLS